MSDLGTREGAHPVRTTAVLYTLVVLAAALPPIFLSGRWWIILAVLWTFVAAFGIWVLPDHLM